MSILDWEKKFKGKNDDSEFSLNESIFILTIAKFQPVDSKPRLKTEILHNGLSETDYRDTYEMLKKKQVLRFNIRSPRGWYADEKVVKALEKHKDLKDLIKRKRRKSAKSARKRRSTTIDSFIDENPEFDTDMDITHDEFIKIVKEWRDKNL